MAENKRRSTKDDVNPESDEAVVYIDNEGNEVESAEELTSGGIILRGEEAEAFQNGEALPQYGIEGEEKPEAKTRTTPATKEADKPADKAAAPAGTTR